MGAVGFSCLLSSVVHCNRGIWKENKLRGFESHGDSSLPKLVPKPDPVLLEDPRSKTGSKRHDQTVILFSAAKLIPLKKLFKPLESLANNNSWV